MDGDKAPPPLSTSLDDTDRTIGVTDLGRMLGLTSKTIYTMAADGRLPRPLSFSRQRLRWRLQTIRAWMTRQETEGGAADAADPLRLHQAEPVTDPGQQPPSLPAEPAVTPEMGRAPVVARLVGVSLATWWRLSAAGKTPRSVKLGGSTLWRLAEIRDWITAGCPDRKTWEAMRRGR